MALSERDIVGVVFAVLIFVVVGAYCLHVVLTAENRKVFVRRIDAIKMQAGTTQGEDQQRDVEHGLGESEGAKEGESWIKRWIRRSDIIMFFVRSITTDGVNLNTMTTTIDTHIRSFVFDYHKGI
ncbi:hypothetical protein P171DRAFT_481653 [Karstenula rhodostoma CBS 690.94]|uniref:Uncharacterized protein n=1 Tax=Karstenula rhodostoma CBS 690.94 TaxID=1392251 RepID=A0A9P4PTM4_9PLEO|nr:hypothetical protein P171DRAFT_481653 [Karstenula rhodostoma CBS 690.94]